MHLHLRDSHLFIFNMALSRRPRGVNQEEHLKLSHRHPAS